MRQKATTCWSRHTHTTERALTKWWLDRMYGDRMWKSQSTEKDELCERRTVNKYEHTQHTHTHPYIYSHTRAHIHSHWQSRVLSIAAAKRLYSVHIWLSTEAGAILRFVCIIWAYNIVSDTKQREEVKKKKQVINHMWRKAKNNNTHTRYTHRKRHAK